MSIIKSVHIDKFRGFHDVEIPLGGDVVAITGQNGVQKTTLLGMLSQPFSLVNEEASMHGAKTIDGLSFGSQLREKFKFSPTFDVPGAHAWTLTLDPDVCGQPEYSCVSIAREKRKGSEIRFWTADKSRKKGTGYLHVPVIFLSLKRLLPIGELPKVKIAASELDDDEFAFFKKWHNEILFTRAEITAVSHIQGQGKSSLAPATKEYDATAISAGQDNVGKIILSVLSFMRLKRQFPNDYKGGLIFIDEIETAMYPAAQIQLLKFMFKMASKSECGLQFFFTTHSETILRFLKVSVYSRKSNVVFLQKLDEAINYRPLSSLSDIENNLFLNAFDGRVPPPSKIRVYAEDEVGFMFVSAMLKNDIKGRVEMQKKVSLSAGQYKTLIVHRVPEFENSVIVLDGDKNGTKDGIRESEKSKFKQVAFLPSSHCPEKMLYLFFHSLKDADPFWENESNTFTYQMCFSGFFETPVDTKGFKTWFDNLQKNDGTPMQRKMVQYWVKNHPDETRKFREAVLAAYNFVAPKHGMEGIEA